MYSGGGSSDVRLTDGLWDEIKSLRSRIMVAAGGPGGQAAAGNSSGAGGALIGISDGGNKSPGGGQVEPPPNSSIVEYGGFGFGAHGLSGWSYSGAGSGYYGGGIASGQPHSSAGGSSFISGHPGCNAIRDENSTIHTGQPIHYSNIFFTNTKLLAGNELMPNPRGTNEIVGNNGHGFVKITLIEYFNTNLYFIKLNNKVFYYKDKWIDINKDENELTIGDIIEHGMGNESKYINKKYLTKLQQFEESGNIEFIMGSHSIEELQNLTIRPLDEVISLNTPYNFNTIK